MAKLKFNSTPKVNNDTGFGNNPNYGGRFINRDGTFNIKKQGQSFFQRVSLFHNMLNLPAWQFAIVLVSFFIVINLTFTTVYVIIGRISFKELLLLPNGRRSRKSIFSVPKLLQQLDMAE